MFCLSLFEGGEKKDKQKSVFSMMEWENEDFPSIDYVTF